MMNTHSIKISLQVGEVEVLYTDALVKQICDRYHVDNVDESLIKEFLTTELRSAMAKVTSK